MNLNSGGIVSVADRVQARCHEQVILKVQGKMKNWPAGLDPIC